MRDLLALLISVQMIFAPAIAFAQVGVPPPPPLPADATPAGGVPRPPPGDTAAKPEPVQQQTSPQDDVIPEGPKTRKIECRELECNGFLASVKDLREAKKLIDLQLGANNRGRNCTALNEVEFLRKLVKIEEGRTEAGGCEKCLMEIKRQLNRTPDGGTKAFREITGAVTCQLAPKPAPVIRAPPAVTPPPPPVDGGGIVEGPPVLSRPSHRHPVEVVDEGYGGNGGGVGGGLFGGGSFMNSNMMWGIGGLAVGGLLVYMIGKNSQQQQYPPPYWQGLGPYGGPYGQVPPGPFGAGARQLPYMYPATGGFGMGGPMAQRFGAPNILPYGGGAYGQPGYNNMIPGGGYQGGYGAGGYNLGTGFSGGCGFCSNTGTNWGGYNSPVYNYGTPPGILPYR